MPEPLQCPQCGAPLEQGAARCEYCGTAFERPVAPLASRPVVIDRSTHDDHSVHIRAGGDVVWHD